MIHDGKDLYWSGGTGSLLRYHVPSRITHSVFVSRHPAVVWKLEVVTTVLIPPSGILLAGRFMTIRTTRVQQRITFKGKLDNQ